MEQPAVDRVEKLGSTTVLGTVLCTVGSLMVLLSALALVFILTCCDDDPISMSGPLNMAGRVGLLLTGVAVLRRSPRTEFIAVITLGVTLVAVTFDVVKFFGSPIPADVPTDLYQSSAIGAGIGFALILALIIVTVLHIRRPAVRREFGRELAVPPNSP